jgi:hypothetical protein
MILGLVFSMDRAMQLDAMLRSFFQQATDVDVAQMVVLYRTSQGRHRAQYAKLANEYLGRVQFMAETDFRSQLLGLLNDRTRSAHRESDVGSGNSTRLSASQNHVLFLVDDALFVRPFRLGDAAGALDSNPDALGFSLRLGRNTSKSYVQSRAQDLPEFDRLGGAVLKFRWTAADGDFAYPLELSSSMYRASTAAGLFQSLRFSNPNNLESQMSLQARAYAQRNPFLLCWEQSVAFSAPLNRVQTVYENRVGQEDAYSVRRMSDLFDRGQRIDLGALTGFIPSACHEEVDLQFTDRAA